MEYIKEEADCYDDNYLTSNHAEKTAEIHNYSDNTNTVYSEQLMMKTETLDIRNSTLTFEENNDNDILYKAESLFSSNLHFAPEKGNLTIHYI